MKNLRYPYLIAGVVIMAFVFGLTMLAKTFGWFDLIHFDEMSKNLFGIVFVSGFLVVFGGLLVAMLVGAEMNRQKQASPDDEVGG